jgi:hypothetical protein
MRPPFAWHPNAPVFVCSDGAEVLAYDARTEGPSWRFAASATVSHLAASSSAVFALSEDGTLARLDASHGRLLGTDSFGTGVRGIALTADERPAVLTRDGVMVDRSLVGTGPTIAAAFHPDRRHALILREGARLELFDMQRCAPLAAARVSAQARAVTWCAAGPAWLVADGSSIELFPLRLEGHQSWVTVAGQQFEDVLARNDGALVLARAGELVLALGFPDRAVYGQIQYLDKTVGQLAFGPEELVGIGLNAGDANKIDLATGSVCRSDPHQGRPRNRWMLSVELTPRQPSSRPATSGKGASRNVAAWVGVGLAILGVLAVLLRAAT